MAGIAQYQVESRTLTEQYTAVETATLAVADIGAWMGKALGETASYLGRTHAGPAGPPFARYHRVGDQRFEVEAGFPATMPTPGDGDVAPSTLPAGTVAVTIHVGPFDAMVPAYTALAAWVDEHGGEPAGDPWEVYLSDPGAQPDPATWRTEVVMPYRAR